MSEANSIVPISNGTPVFKTSETPSTQAAAPAAPVVDGKISANSTFSSLSGLSQMAPEVAQALAQGIAMNIVSDMKRGAKRLKNMMRTGTPDGSGPPVNS